MEAMRHAIGLQDAAGLERAAHAMLGAVSTFCAPRAAAAARKLESIGRDGTLQDASAAYATLQAALAELEPALTRLSNDITAASHPNDTGSFAPLPNAQSCAGN
jgi:HPt (histidine-containing phosphotransfer) domain-containing protein